MVLVVPYPKIHQPNHKAGPHQLYLLHSSSAAFYSCLNSPRQCSDTSVFSGGLTDKNAWQGCHPLGVGVISLTSFTNNGRKYLKKHTADNGIVLRINL